MSSSLARRCRTRDALRTARVLRPRAPPTERRFFHHHRDLLSRQAGPSSPFARSSHALGTTTSTSFRRSSSSMGGSSMGSSMGSLSEALRISRRDDARPSLFDDRGDDDDDDDEDKQKHLRADIRTMGAMLGRIIREHSGEDVIRKVESLRHHAKAWRKAGAGRVADPEADEAFASMTTATAALSTRELLSVTRAFAHFLGIANAAEFHHRSRRNDEALRRSSSSNSDDSSDVGALPVDKEDSCGGTLRRLLRDGVVDADGLLNTLTSQTVEIVLTAHPTEVNRRTLLDKHRRIQEVLDAADVERRRGRACTPYERRRADATLEREIGLVWQSDELSRSKPTVQSEAERGTLVVETVLWEALPNFLRRLDATLGAETGGKIKGLPLTAAPFKFSSWMGGDRDGNPNVTPAVTQEVGLRNRVRAATLVERDLSEIASRLSTTYCSDELWAVLNNKDKDGKDGKKKNNSNVREPYRAFLRPILTKLRRTVDWANQELDKLRSDRDDDDDDYEPDDYETHLARPRRSQDNIDASEVYLDKQELLDALLLVHESLIDTNNAVTANGRVLDLIRNLHAFGLTLVPLDVRQESDRHAAALDAVTRRLGLDKDGNGVYSQWDEATKSAWLAAELTSDRPLLRPGEWRDRPDIFTDDDVDTLETFRTIADANPGDLNAYVISQATSASDVLAVALLQKDAGVEKPLRVVPLFETLDDLRGATDTMETLFTMPAYRGGNLEDDFHQEIMIGYSDSAKDAGRLAASWAQYETQEKLAALAKKHNVTLTFFHGKGGTVGRGGNPATFKAILSHAPDTIHGRFRVTEQGEMIHQNFGHVSRAERTLDIYTAAVCAERHAARAEREPTPEQRAAMDRLSAASCAAYRAVVRDDPRFVPYFRQATPETELSGLNIGSRPAKRGGTGGVESLRAIPWIFAWTQTRFNLPTWLGVGRALREALDDGPPEEREVLRNMYRDWPSFRTTVDLVEMVLSKSEPSVAKHYEDVLVEDDGAKELGALVREAHAETERAVRDLTGRETFCEHNELLQQALKVRNPYVDCLNVLQAETLRRMRKGDDNNDEEDDEERRLLNDALLISITGIANGMGNTG